MSLRFSVPCELLVLEGYYGAAVAAEGGDALQVAVGAGDGHHGAVAVDGVSGSGEIPASAFGSLGQMRDWLPQSLLLRRQLGDGQT
jgi:hypothetical protein